MAAQAISVVLPVYNEGAALAHVLERLEATLTDLRQRHAVELVIVDDGSTDATAQIVADFVHSHAPGARACTHPANKGLVEALKTGARAATGSTLVMLDADLSYSPDLIEPLALTLAGRGAAAVLASPYMKGGRTENVPFDRLLASRAANWLLARCVGGRLKTFTGMVRAYDAATVRDLMNEPVRGEFNAWIVARLLENGATVIEIPAALVWPQSRVQAPSRMTWTTLARRVRLVLETATVLSAAGRSAAAARPIRAL